MISDLAYDNSHTTIHFKWTVICDCVCNIVSIAIYWNIPMVFVDSNGVLHLDRIVSLVGHVPLPIGVYFYNVLSV